MRGLNGARLPILFTAGELMVERHARHPGYLGVGGAAANAAVAFVRAGGRAAFACRLAEDEYMPLLKGELERVGLWSPAVVLGGPFNAVYTIGADCPYGRFGYAREGSAGGRLALKDLDGELVTGADVVLISGVFASLNPTTRGTVRRILDLASPGAVVAYDVNHRPALASPEDARALYEELSSRITFVKADLDEGRLLWGGGDPLEVSRRGASRHPLVMLTLGADGLVLVADGGPVIIPAAPVECVDPTGAGDAALGTALFHFALGRSPGETGRAAADAGARCVGSLGAWGYAVGNSFVRAVTLVPSLQKLLAALRRLPGVGPKSAQRIGYHILRASREEAAELARAIVALKDRVVARCAATWRRGRRGPRVRRRSCARSAPIPGGTRAAS